ncbi:hypothetical protein ACRCJW_05485 [Aerococcus urinaeequi]|uniref:hypothetical protein n=1 Tax=Aerococcus urinaeequi TaxID=51665 RepID=UPI003D6ABDA0
MDFKEAKQRKERGISVKQLLAQAVEVSDDIETVVIITKHKDMTVRTSFSSNSTLEMLGMLSIAETQLIVGMTE